MVSNEPETVLHDIYVVASKSSGNLLVLFIIIFDCEGIVHYEFIPGDKTANKDVYIYIFRRFMDAFRRKRPEKCRTNGWFLLHDNAPAHRSVLCMDFLAKNKVTTLEHPSILLT